MAPRNRRGPKPRSPRLLEPLEARTLLATILWDGGGDGVTLTDAANWDADVLPGAADDAVINQGGVGTVELNAGTFSVLSLTCSEHVAVSGGTLEMAAASSINGTLTLSGGVIAGDGDLDLAGLVWTGGTMEGGGEAVVVAGGTFLFPTNATLVLARDFRNEGTGTHEGGTLALAAATFTNNGTITMDADTLQPAIAGWGGTSVFLNAGTLHKNGSLTMFLSHAVGPLDFNSTGTFNINAGLVEAVSTGTVSGSVVIASGATLLYADDYAHTGGATYGGAGTLTFVAGTHDFSNTVTLAGLTTLAGATWAGGGTLNITGTLTWTSGAMTGGGQTVVALGAAANLSGSGTKVLQRTLTNNGVVNHTGGALQMTGGTVVNAPGRPYNSSGVAPILGTGGTNLFDNQGVFRKTGPSTLTITAPFSSAGTLSVAGGIMNLDGGGTNTGARNISSGATLAYRASYTHGAGSTLAGSGDVNWEGGTQTIAGDWTANTFLKLVSGTLNGAGTLSTSGPFSWLSGDMAGTGSIVINPTGKLALATGGSKTLARTIVNNGVLHWLNGFLSLGGATITNAAGRTFAILPEATVNVTGGTNTIHNAGTLIKMAGTSVTFSEFNGGVRLNNTGLVDVRNGSLTFSGPVSQVSGATLTGGSWQVYPATTLTLTGAQVSTIGAAATVWKVGSSADFNVLTSLESNQGTINLWRGTQLQVASDATSFTNSGTINFERGARLSVQQAFVNTSTGVLNLGMQGTSPSLFARVFVAGLATLGGTVTFDFVGGFDPPAGTAIQFITSTLRAGEFDTVTIPPLGGRTGMVEYLGNGARLVIS